MFDIGFWELCLIGLIALVVVGPDRFPGMIRSVGYWMGRFRQIATNVKNEIQTEVDKAEQLKQLMSEQEDILKRQLESDASEMTGISPAAQKAAERSRELEGPSDSEKTVDVVKTEQTSGHSDEQRPNGKS